MEKNEALAKASNRAVPRVAGGFCEPEGLSAELAGSDHATLFGKHNTVLRGLWCQVECRARTDRCPAKGFAP
jgi:hypothetical protein